MHKLETDDVVKFTSKGEEIYGYIRETTDNSSTVILFISGEKKRIQNSRLVYVAPVKLTKEEIRSLCRYEIKWSELLKKKGASEFASTIFDCYTLTLYDLLTALKNISASSDDSQTVYKEWYSPVCDFMYDAPDWIVPEESPESVESLEFLPGRSSFIVNVLNNIEEILNDEKADIKSFARFAAENIEIYLEEERKPLLQRQFSDADKEAFIRQMDNEARLKAANETALCLFRQFTDELCEKDNLTALHCKGYGCYGGNPAFDCNWSLSLDCITRLYEQTGGPVYANTLGYIYYYGRCWDGEPQYDDAFYYFSIGAAGGFYESRYKLADLYVKGWGVKKNTKIAFSIMSELYDQNIAYILEGNYNCKFADVALRLGSYMEEGYGSYTSFIQAYKFYLQADFAIKQRMKYNNYGDLKVAQSISQSLAKLSDSGKVDKPARSAPVCLDDLLYSYLKKFRRLQLRVKQSKSGSLKLEIKIKPLKTDKYPPKLFITDTGTAFCGVLEKLTLKVKNMDEEASDIKTDTFDFDNINIDHNYESGSATVIFSLEDEIKAKICADLIFSSPVRRSGERYRIASVYFQPGGKYYDYLLDIDDVEKDDTVIVETSEGEKEVTVACISEKYESELPLPITKYKKISRKK